MPRYLKPWLALRNVAANEAVQLHVHAGKRTFHARNFANAHVINIDSKMILKCSVIKFFKRVAQEVFVSVLFIIISHVLYIFNLLFQEFRLVRGVQLNRKACIETGHLESVEIVHVNCMGFNAQAFGSAGAEDDSRFRLCFRSEVVRVAQPAGNSKLTFFPLATTCHTVSSFLLVEVLLQKKDVTEIDCPSQLLSSCIFYVCVKFTCKVILKDEFLDFAGRVRRF